MGDDDGTLRTQTRRGENAIEIRVAGTIDIATADELRELLDAQPPVPAVLRVDLSGVDVLSAAGVRVLVGAYLERRRRGGQLVLCNPTPTVRRALRATHVNRLIPIVGTGVAGTDPRRPPGGGAAGALRGRRWPRNSSPYRRPALPLA
ncbi:anti-sigma factor antagonist [Micromonospora sp. NPDC049559]|uniref:anti-sigma factor antagonist n=1 Tax=Micromonospora sp. NPDC049559 TaxID=3155923 RepID=UPI003415996F